MINFKVLSAFQLTTFVLGIVFSILTIAMIFYTLRRPNGYRNTFLKVLFVVILPMVTFIMWFACVFGAYELFNASELYCFLLAIACGAALSGLTTLIAWLINKFIKKGEPELDEESETESAEHVIVDDEATETEEVQENAEAETEAEQVEETETEETETTEAEEVETTEEAETTETEEVEATEEVEPESETAEVEETEAEEQTEEATEEAETEEAAEEEIEEPIEETIEETADEQNENVQETVEEPVEEQVENTENKEEE